MVCACSGKSSREWRDQSTVEHKYSVWPSDRDKTTWLNSYWQERIKEDNCCTSWCNKKEKEKVEKYQNLGIERWEDCRNWEM